MRPRNPWCLATGSIVRTGCTTVPLEKSARACSMAGITSSMRNRLPTAFSFRFIRVHLLAHYVCRPLPPMVVDGEARRIPEAQLCTELRRISLPRTRMNRTMGALLRACL